MDVKPIDKKRTHEYILNYHYAKRLPQIRHAFGLFDGADLVGVVTYGIPASYTLCKGVCGEEHKKKVLELSRLVVVPNERNRASMLIGRSLKQLPPSIVVSYADCNDHVGHVGYVYQATNWYYTGQGNAEPIWLHPETGDVVSNTRRHIDRKAEKIGLTWQELVRKPQQGKHRYVTFTGTRRDRKAFESALRYQVLPYPKGKTRKHGSVECRNLF